jgi:hypothetical protein
VCLRTDEFEPVQYHLPVRHCLAHVLSKAFNFSRIGKIMNKEVARGKQNA